MNEPTDRDDDLGALDLDDMPGPTLGSFTDCTPDLYLGDDVTFSTHCSTGVSVVVWQIDDDANRTPIARIHLTSDHALSGLREALAEVTA